MMYRLWVFHLIWRSKGPGKCCFRAQGRARWPTHRCSVNPHLLNNPPSVSYTTVVSGTQRLFSGSQSTEEWETAALHAPKSLHDFLIGGSGLCVQRLESGLRCQSSTPWRAEEPYPPQLNLGPVKAVRHTRSGWVASEGERGRVTELAVEKSSLRLRRVGRREPGGNVYKGRKNLCETAERRSSPAPK